jgi:hypothetical protein
MPAPTPASIFTAAACCCSRTDLHFLFSFRLLCPRCNTWGTQAFLHHDFPTCRHPGRLNTRVSGHRRGRNDGWSNGLLSASRRGPTSWAGLVLLRPNDPGGRSGGGRSGRIGTDAVRHPSHHKPLPDNVFRQSGTDETDSGQDILFIYSSLLPFFSLREVQRSIRPSVPDRYKSLCIKGLRRDR